MPFKIGNRVLSSDKPYIIAELGSNWLTFTHAKDAISLAKSVGADAVKFQLYDHRALYGWDTGQAISGQMPVTYLPQLKEKAEAVGIEFMCTAFSPSLLDEVNKVCNVHKIASSNMADVTMLDRVSSFKKPTFISVGGWPHGDVVGTEHYLNKKGFKDFCFMYCVSDYPANFINLGYLKKLRAIHPIVGFSDHTTNIYPLPTMAALEDAVAIEKHFNPFDLVTADSPHSLGINDFQLMVKGIKGEINEGMKDNGATEMRLKHLVRIVAIEDVEVGTVLIRDKNFGIHRSKEPSAHGAHPASIFKMEGKKMGVAKKQGEGISLNDVQVGG